MFTTVVFVEDNMPVVGLISRWSMPFQKLPYVSHT